MAKTLEQDATKLVHKWQSVASYGVPDELSIALHVGVVDTGNNNNGTGIGSRRTIQATFTTLFLGPAAQLLQVMEKKFPELGMKQEDCKEMRWVESTSKNCRISRWNTVDILLNRWSSLPKTTFKAKSDFVTRPIPKVGLEGIWKRIVYQSRSRARRRSAIIPELAARHCIDSSSPSKALAQQHNFLQCVASHSNQSMPQLYVPKSPSFLSVLQSSIYNLRFTSPATPKPLFIITPNHESQIRAVVVCSKKHGLKITVRSGGHDFEGLSYRANVPFVLIDLVNFRTIDVNIKDNSAWVQAGATLGEVYYRIAEKSPVHGFPAGACPTVGVGGHISGGGFGLMVRKYGMAADHVLDARIINVKGEILDRKTMGEDLFWAIRGGGVTSFGVLLAWKIRLVPVPLLILVSTMAKTLEQDATKLVHKWQSSCKLWRSDELSIALHIGVVDTSNNNNGTGIRSRRTIQATFTTLFLGPLRNFYK
ncbi:hypothetical protein Syun_026451 [Stephania yunnanensis]|uniref:FAD-binding PCMH-type domain-containing protein n=1 Tax=Stephania yunnanensis TaxID=152371 RepID=A0AAP0HWQ5_9MAGN